jgi:hypothetical protein
LHEEALALAYQRASNILDLTDLVLGGLGRGQDDGQLLPLVCGVQAMSGGMRRVILSERSGDATIQLLNENATNADGVGALRLKWTTGVHDALIELDDRRCHKLAIGANTRLLNVVQRSMGLVAVIGAKLSEDGMSDMVETKLEDLGVNLLDEAIRINIGLAKIEISMEEGDRPILNDDVEDEQANVCDR